MGNLSEHFDRAEFQCRCGCGWDTVDAELIRVLEDLRQSLDNRPITINSGCRCKMYNALVGGSPKSQHLLGKAADIRVEGFDPSEVADFLEDKYSNCYGIGRYDSFTHVDVRSGAPARWGGKI